MKNIILTILLLASTTLAHGTHFKREAKKEDVVYARVIKQILKNKPKLNKKVARQLASSIVKHSTHYKMSPYRAAAIAMQESSYSFAMNYNKDSSVDVGFFQINSRTAKEHGLNLKKLMTDVDYSVEAYFKVMKEKLKICKNLKSESWQCYHSRTETKRTIYKKLVNRYYASY